MGILDELIEFADEHSIISAIYKGYNPEEKNYLTYYFLVPAKLDIKFEKEILDLDSRLSKKTKESFIIISLPITIEDAVNYPFLGKCVYKK